MKVFKGAAPGPGIAGEDKVSEAVGFRVTCGVFRCGWRGDSTGCRHAPDPFCPGETLRACPRCGGQSIRTCCDEPGCWEPDTCGTPTADGYRRTCSKHVPKPGPVVAGADPIGSAFAAPEVPYEYRLTQTVMDGVRTSLADMQHAALTQGALNALAAAKTVVDLARLECGDTEAARTALMKVQDELGRLESKLKEILYERKQKAQSAPFRGG